jgi:hypothetical protein
MMVDACNQLGIKYMFATAEADMLLGYLAKNLTCSVTSCDSDFFIYDIKSFVPLYNWPNLIEYSRIDIAKVLGVKPDFLFIFAVLCGNDCFSALELDTLYLQNPHMGISKKKRWDSVVKFIKRFEAYSPSEFCNIICQKVSKYWSPRLRSAFDYSYRQYEIVSCAESLSTDMIFIHQYIPSMFPNTSNEPVNKSCINKMYDRLITKTQQGLVAPKILELLNLKIFYCTPFEEDLNSGIYF